MRTVTVYRTPGSEQTYDRWQLASVGWSDAQIREQCVPVQMNELTPEEFAEAQRLGQIEARATGRQP